MAEEEPQFTDAESLLRHYAARFVALGQEADRVLKIARDTDAHKRILEQRASIIRDLPLLIEERGLTLTEDLRNGLLDLSEEAKIAIDSVDDRFRLARLTVLAVRRGSQKGDANVLEKLISESYGEE